MGMKIGLKNWWKGHDLAILTILIIICGISIFIDAILGVI